MALFGEKYGEVVRTVMIGETEPVSYELCGGTHVHETGDIGLFLIVSEGSAAAGVRRIEAVTGRGAYELVQKRFRNMRKTAEMLSASMDEVPERVENLLDEMSMLRKAVASLRQQVASLAFDQDLEKVTFIEDVAVLTSLIQGVDADTLRSLADRFRQRYSTGVVVLASVVDGKPVIIGAVTDDLVKRNFHAGDLVKRVAAVVGGGGGGRPTLAQAGGRDVSRLSEALDQTYGYVKEKARK